MASPTAGTRYFRVKNLDKYQHYRDRNPPWIKLHQSVTEDTAFALLPDAAKSHLMLIWLLASRMDNRLPFDAVFIGARINARDAVDLNLLLERGFLVLEPLARRKQGASKPLSKPERPNRDIEERTQRENNDPPSPPAHAGGPVNGNGHGPPADVLRRERLEAKRRIEDQVEQARQFALGGGYRLPHNWRRTFRGWFERGASLAHVQEGIEKGDHLPTRRL